MFNCEILRIGHRPERDKRITTHVALTARAFGASGISIHRPDSRILDTVSDVGVKFGGDFKVETTDNPKNFVKNWNGKVVHLTMFGIPIDNEIDVIKESKEPLLFVVGAEKVPPWVFEYSDYNISVGNQPHSEVAALAIALNKVCGDTYSKDYDGALKVIPSATHRQMIDNRDFD